MKQTSLPLSLFCLAFSSLVQAQTVRVAPVSRSPLSVPAAVGVSALPSNSSLGSSGFGQPGLSAFPSLDVQAAPKVLLAAPNAALGAALPAPAQAAPAMPAPSASRALPSRAPGAPLAAPSAQDAASAPAGPDALGSLKAAAEPRGDEQAPGAAASALFDGASQKAEPKEWTFMVFLNGHNSLNGYGELNIKQMEKVGSNDRLNIVVQWASLGKPTKRMLIQRSESGDVTSKVIEELPAVDMGSVDRLYDFVKWTVERFPAQRYMLDLWDHGGGWHFKRDGAANPLDISWDDQTGSYITTEQLGDVMRRVKELIGRPVDVLGFDACLMAMAEVMAQIGDAVHYVAASEQTEPGAGWPYEKVLTQWLESKSDDGAALVKALTDQYTAAYGRNVTFSGVDMTKFPAFVEAAKALAKELAALDAAKFAQVRKAAQSTQRYAYDDYGDFLDFIAKLSASPVALVSAPVLAAAADAFKAMIVANKATADMSGSNGASVWMPLSSYVWQQYGARYLALVWHLLTDWGQFAHRLSGARELPESKPAA